MTVRVSSSKSAGRHVVDVDPEDQLPAALGGQVAGQRPDHHQGPRWFITSPATVVPDLADALPATGLFGATVRSRCRRHPGSAGRRNRRGSRAASPCRQQVRDRPRAEQVGVLVAAAVAERNSAGSRPACSRNGLISSIPSSKVVSPCFRARRKISMSACWFWLTLKISLMFSANGGDVSSATRSSAA